VTVADGTPTLTLNDGGTATYVSGSGNNALSFNYTGKTTLNLRVRTVDHAVLHVTVRFLPAEVTTALRGAL
jgi:hypothetical protein